MPYREDRHALEARLAALEKQLAEVRARASELEELKKTEADAVREIESVRRTLADLDAGRRRLPTLESIRIASPCSARWEEMIGDDRVRFCAHCEKNVFNLSAMTRAEAEALLVEKEGKLCARMYQRADGTVLTADCPVGVRRKRVRRVAAFAIAGGGLAAAAMALTHRQGDVQVVAGGVEIAPTMGTAIPVPSAAPEIEAPHHTMGVVAVPMPAPSATTKR